VKPPGSRNDADPADAARERLRVALRQAMRIGDRLETSGLRTLIAAIDDAQAVPVGDGHTRYVVREFGDRSAEVPRLGLSATEVRALLEREAASLLDAATDLESCGKADDAGRLRTQAAIVSRHIESAGAAAS